VVSSDWRAAARPTPSSSPTASARARLRAGRGDTGVAGTSAALTTVSRTADFSPPGRLSRVGISLANSAAVASAIRAASAGEGSVAVNTISTVSGTASPVTLPATWSAVIVRCRRSTTRCINR